MVASLDPDVPNGILLSVAQDDQGNDETGNNGGNREVFSVQVGDTEDPQRFPASFDGGPGPGLLIPILGSLRENIERFYGNGSRVLYRGGVAVFDGPDGRPADVAPDGDFRLTALANANDAIWFFMLAVTDPEGNNLAQWTIRASADRDLSLRINTEENGDLFVFADVD